MMNVLIYAGALFFQPQAHDSLGIETVNGKIFVVHKVGEKETLYGISKRYGSSVEAVLQYNPSATDGLDIGEILKVPYTPKSPAPTRPAGAIVHVVAAKETMFSISKAYNVSIEDIRQWNNLSDNALAVGQEIVIRRRNTVDSPTAATPAAASPASSAITAGSKDTHVVETKETLYSIASKYGITVQQLKDWNNITGNEISIGQVLVVKQSTRTPSAVNPSASGQPTAATPAPASTTPKTVTTNTPASSTPTASSTQTPAPAVKTETPQTIRVSESVRSGDEVSQSGVAELIEGTEGNRKYLALHRTAPIGTILKVKNEMNNREVFVRVMGKLPDTSDKTIIRISKSAFDRLGAIDPRFRVEVTYYK